MLSKETQKKILQLLRLPDEQINTLIGAAEEQDLSLPDGLHILTSAELTTRDSSKYSEGKDAGLETAIKEFKKTNDLDFKGKTLKDLYDHLSSGKDEAEAMAKLQTDVAALTTERDTIKAQLNSMHLQNRLYALVPELTNGMNKAEALGILQANGFEFKEEDGALTAYRHGARLKDDGAETFTPADAAVKNFFGAEKNWLADPDAANNGKTGGGGSNSSTKARPQYTRTSEVEKAFNDRYGPGASLGTEHDFAGHLQKIMKEAEASGTPLLMD